MLTLILVTILLGIAFWRLKKPSGLPPGRWGLPVIGYIPLHTRNISDVLNTFRKDYGDIFTWKLGQRCVVGLCDYNLIKTTFSKPECQGRVDFYTFDVFKNHANAGFLSSVGDTWQEGRRFAIRHLKDHGMGKSSMEGIILYEALTLAKHYEKTAGTPVEISWNLNVAVLNVIWKLVADQRYETDDEEIIAFNKMVIENFDIIQGPAALLDFIPILLKILPDFIVKDWMKVGKIYSNLKTFGEFSTKIIKKHKETLDPNNHRDYIDAYLTEIEKQKHNPDSIFKEDYGNLLTSIADLFGAGSETTSSTMRWLVALMAINPRVQEKVHKEIDDIIPNGRDPSLEDKEKMPYTEAVLLEVLRFSSLLPIGVFHTNTKDIEVGGYHLPANTALFAFAEGCHKDTKYFEKPNEFYPEHFLDNEGRVIHKKEGFLPFSLGRRQCLGESLAKMELFFFATCLLQKFTIAPPEGVTITAETDRTQPILNVIKPYKVVMTKRE